MKLRCKKCANIRASEEKKLTLELKKASEPVDDAPIQYSSSEQPSEGKSSSESDKSLEAIAEENEEGSSLSSSSSSSQESSESSDSQ